MKVRYRQTFYAVSLLITDIFMILAALRFVFWFRFESGLVASSSGTPHYQIYAQAFGLVVIITIAIYRAYGLYLEEKVSVFLEEVGLVIRATSFMMLLLLAISFSLLFDRR